MKTPYDRLAKICTNCTGHMTKMATMPIYGKNPLNIFFSGTKSPMALGLGMKHWGCRPYQICTNDESRLTLTYIMARSNLIPIVFIWEKTLKCSFFYNCPGRNHNTCNLMGQWFYISTKCQADL